MEDLSELSDLSSFGLKEGFELNLKSGKRISGRPRRIEEKIGHC
jgi:hypothetical protein